EVAAAVLAQIHHQPVDAFLLELLEQARDVARRARVVLLAPAAGREVLIEARHLDHADAVRAALERYLEQLLLRGLLLELHLVAGEGDDLLGRPGGGTG